VPYQLGDAPIFCYMVERAGFEPAKSKTADLQSAPFSHSGTSPYLTLVGATGFEPAASRSRTVRATKLRYAPNAQSQYVIIHISDEGVKRVGALLK
jgi:hypothetical protein